jgi:hypothetical protein
MEGCLNEMIFLTEYKIQPTMFRKSSSIDTY